MECLRSHAIMFYNYFRNEIRWRACGLHYTREHPCLHSQYLLSRVEGSANALTFRLRKINCILCQKLSARTPHGTTHSERPPYTSVVFTRASSIFKCNPRSVQKAHCNPRTHPFTELGFNPRPVLFERLYTTNAIRKCRTRFK